MNRRLETIDDYLPPLALDPAQPQAISPTDLAQYLRLDQCRRYLRLRLHERRKELNWLPRYGMSLQPIPPMLTIAGRRFEQAIEAQVRARFPQAIHCAQRRQQGDPAFMTDDHNHIVLAHIQQLAPNTAQVLFQPRLASQLHGWAMSGDVDLLLLSCDDAGACHAVIIDTKVRRRPRSSTACSWHVTSACSNRSPALPA